MRLWMVMLGFLITSCAMAQTGNEAERAADEAVLRELQLPTKGPELLQILRERTPTAEAVQEFKKHVARLKAANYPGSLKAAADLEKMGPLVRPLGENVLL